MNPTMPQASYAKMKTIMTLHPILAAVATLFLLSMPAAVAAETVHDFTVKDIKGEDVDLATYKDKVLLIVNVASECGATPQYATLVALQEAYADKGLVVLGFPTNDFGGQEPGSNEEIAEFCSSTYDVNFPMFAKIPVSGDNRVPLFSYLASAPNPDEEGDIGWNFEKFLVGKDGKLLRRFATHVEPDSEEIISAIDEALK